MATYVSKLNITKSLPLERNAHLQPYYDIPPPTSRNSNVCMKTKQQWCIYILHGKHYCQSKSKFCLDNFIIILASQRKFDTDITPLSNNPRVSTWISSSVLGTSLLHTILWNLCSKGRRGALVPCADRSLSVSLVPLSQSWSNNITADNIWLKEEVYIFN